MPSSRRHQGRQQQRSTTAASTSGGPRDHEEEEEDGHDDHDDDDASSSPLSASYYPQRQQQRQQQQLGDGPSVGDNDALSILGLDFSSRPPPAATAAAVGTDASVASVEARRLLPRRLPVRPLRQRSRERVGGNDDDDAIRKTGEMMAAAADGGGGRYGSMRLVVTAPVATGRGANADDDDDSSYDLDLDVDDDDDIETTIAALDRRAKEQILGRVSQFRVEFDADRGYRATRLKFWSWSRPHMRAFHASWMCFFADFFVQYSQAPLLSQIQTSLDLKRSDIWWTNLWMMLGGVPTRFLLGPLCDKYGARATMTAVLGAAAVPAALTGLMANSLTTLTVMRCLLGMADVFVCGQYWITCLFVREVGGTAMAIAAGLGSSGSAVTQLVTGSILFPLFSHQLLDDQNDDLAWRLTLVVPALLALTTAFYFYYASDDCPLGSFDQVKKAGLMLERSAVDSFRSGALNLNSWILSAQYAGSCGVDFTMGNGTAMYYRHVFGRGVAASGAMACLYGISALFARGLGGYMSDRVGDKFSLRGRLWAQLLVMVLQGLTNVWFARSDGLGRSLSVMVLFSIFVQMSTGTCYGIGKRARCCCCEQSLILDSFPMHPSTNMIRNFSVPLSVQFRTWTAPIRGRWQGSSEPAGTSAARYWRECL